MSLIVLLAVLALEHYWPRQPAARPPSSLLSLLVSWTASWPTAWARALPLVLLAALLWLAFVIERWLGSLSGLLLLVGHVLVLRTVLSFANDRTQYFAIVDAIRDADPETAQRLAERWRLSQYLPAPEPGPHGVAAPGLRVLRQAIWVVYLHLLVPLSLYLILPGVLGPVLWLILLSWARSPEWSSSALAWVRALESLITAALARLTALAFAIAGHFEEALYGWKRKAWDWPNRHHGILMESALGALGAQAQGTADFEVRPLEALISLVWRVLVVYTVVFALISFAGAFR